MQINSENHVMQYTRQGITKKAFTLIEMLVVIFVLWIWILSISILITKNISVIRNIHTQNTATILAREWLEMTYNIRDTNRLLGYTWDCAQRRESTDTSIVKEWADVCKQYMRSGDGQTYRFVLNGWLDDSKQISMSGINGDDFTTLFEKSKLYLTWITIWDITITWYTHIPTIDSDITTFARYVEFTGMNDLPEKSPLHNNDIHHITSKVLYQLSNTTTGEVSLESFITNQE